MNVASQIFGSPSARPAADRSASSMQTQGRPTPGSMSLRWAALGEAGQVVAALAGVPAEQPSPQVRNFAALMRDAPAWKRELAARACIDLAAVMEPGISALLAISARGANPAPAAQALWREYSAARAAMLTLLPQTGTLGPRRTA